jgi:hypothetical protein
MKMQMGRARLAFAGEETHSSFACVDTSHCTLPTVAYGLQDCRMSTITIRTQEEERTPRDPQFSMKYSCFPKNLSCPVFFYMTDGLFRTPKKDPGRLRKTNFTMFTGDRDRTMQGY